MFRSLLNVLSHVTIGRVFAKNKTKGEPWGNINKRRNAKQLTAR